MLILSFFDGSSVFFTPVLLTCNIDLLEYVVQRSRGFFSAKEKQQIAENMLEDLPNELLENVAEWVRICAYSTTELYCL